MTPEIRRYNGMVHPRHDANQRRLVWQIKLLRLSVAVDVLAMIAPGLCSPITDSSSRPVVVLLPIYLSAICGIPAIVFCRGLMWNPLRIVFLFLPYHSSRTRIASPRAREIDHSLADSWRIVYTLHLIWVLFWLCRLMDGPWLWPLLRAASHGAK